MSIAQEYEIYKMNSKPGEAYTFEKWKRLSKSKRRREARIPSMRGAGASMGRTIGGVVATNLRYIRGAFQRKQTRP